MSESSRRNVIILMSTSLAAGFGLGAAALGAANPGRDAEPDEEAGPANIRIDVRVRDDVTIDAHRDESVSLEGDAYVAPGVETDGSFEASGTATLGPGATVNGDVRSPASVDLGRGSHVGGSVYADEAVLLDADTAADGDVVGSTVTTGEGASVDGAIDERG
jgi:predicted acyltransferase (DUF342 family)